MVLRWITPCWTSLQNIQKTVLYPLDRCQFHKLFIHKSISTQEVYAGNIKIGELARAGNIKAARHLFDKMPERDVVSWNTIVTGYWKNGMLEESKSLFELMLERNVVSWNSMIAGCIENHRIDEGYDYFDRMPMKNTASWNAMISGLVKCGRVEEAEKLFEDMPQRNVISYTALMDGYAQIGEIEFARALFDRIPEKNTVSWTVMINGYVNNGELDEAKRLFDMMPKKHVSTITAMIMGYFKEGMVESARNLFEEISDKDIISWNAMIAGYAQNGNGEEALKLYLRMRQIGMDPDHATLISVLTACSSLAFLGGGRQNHVFVIKEGFESNISVCNALITMYSKCGSIYDSERVFGQLNTPDLVSWNTIIAVYALYGDYVRALDLFTHMGSVGIKPDGLTFLSILSSCGRARKVEESMQWFGSMINNYGITPRAEHYACLVDILSRAGLLQKAYKIILEMPCEANGGVWGAILAACQVYSNVQLGELAASKLVKLEPQNSAAYITMSNIYAAVGMWKEARGVRELMKELGVKKQPGYSRIEFENEVHSFLGGDMSHPEIRCDSFGAGAHQFAYEDVRLFFRPLNAEICWKLARMRCLQK